MTNEEIMGEILIVFRKTFRNPDMNINNETTANDVEEWDSLRHTILMTDIQKHFKVKFKLKEILKLRNVGEICNLVAQKINDN